LQQLNENFSKIVVECVKFTIEEKHLTKFLRVSERYREVQII